MRSLAIACLLTAPLLTACDQHLQSDDGYFAELADAGGLKVGAPVHVAGVQVGRVRSVRLAGQHARVAFSVDPGSTIVVYQDACVRVGWYGIGNGAHLTLEPGSEGLGSLGAGSQIACVKDHPGSAQAERALTAATKLLDSAMSDKGTIGRLLHDEELADRVERYFEANAAAPPPASATSPTDSGEPAGAEPPPAPEAPPSKPPPPAKPKRPDKPVDLIDPFSRE